MYFKEEMTQHNAKKSRFADALRFSEIP